MYPRNAVLSYLVRTASAAVLVLAACAEPPVAPSTDLAPAFLVAGEPTVVMSGLNSPRGLAWGPDGGLYVAEAGTTQATGACATVARGQQCYSGTGSISRLLRGRQQRIVTGLPSLYNAAFNDIIGVNHIGFQGLGNMNVTVGWGGAPDARAQLGQLAAGLGVLLHVRPSGGWSVVADLAALENANPDGGFVDSNPYGLLAEPARTFVVDAGGNSLLEWRPGKGATVIATFPAQPVPPGFPPQFAIAEAVPTTVKRGPDGALYVGTLTGVPFVPGTARIFRVVPGAEPAVWASGFTMIVDMDWAADGSLYVLQYASMPFLGGAGAVIRVAPDGTRTTVTSELTNPTGILVGPDGAIYVSNRGNLAAVGEVLRIVP